MSVKTLTQENFETEILNQKGVALVDFYTTWCGPCKMLSPVIDEIANEHPEITVGKVNVDENNALSAMYGIMSVPTLLVFKDGIVVLKTTGYQSKTEIASMLCMSKEFCHASAN